MMSKAIQVSKDGTILRKGWEFFYGFAVTTRANTGEYKLERDSPVNGERVIGVQMRRKGTTNALSVNGNALVNNDAFDASFLTLKQRNAEVFERIPVYMIWKATEQGLWYPVNIPNIDMNQSSILCSDASLLVTGEDYEIVLKYVNKIIQKK